MPKDILQNELFTKMDINCLAQLRLTNKYFYDLININEILQDRITRLRLNQNINFRDTAVVSPKTIKRSSYLHLDGPVLYLFETSNNEVFYCKHQSYPFNESYTILGKHNQIYYRIDVDKLWKSSCSFYNYDMITSTNLRRLTKYIVQKYGL